MRRLKTNLGGGHRWQPFELDISAEIFRIFMGHDVPYAIIIWITASVGFGAPYGAETICQAVSLRTVLKFVA
jgi:hypothetical protein